MKTKAETKQAIRLSLTGLVVTLLFVAVSVFVYGPNNTAHAAINNEINFQGKLTNPNGTNVTDGSYTVIFSLYTVSSGGSNVWTETDSVTTTSGIFQVNLGAVTSLPGSVNFDSSNLYLGIKVGSDPEMTPRIQFTAVPQAFQATNSDNLGGVAAASYAQLGATQTFTGANSFSGTSTFNNNVLIQPFSNSTSTIQVQNTSGYNILSVDSTNNKITIASGTSTPTATVSLAVSSSTTAYTLTLPIAAPTAASQCLESGSGTYTNLIFTSCGGGGGGVSLAPSVADSDTTTNNSIFINKTGASGNLLDLQNSGSNVFTVGNSGNTTIKNSTNSTTAFQVQDASSVSVLAADTTDHSLVVTGYNPGQVAQVGSNVTTGSNPEYVAISGHYAYVANDGTNYFQIFNISNPTSVTQVGSNVTTGSNPDFIAISGNYAYVTSAGSSYFQIFNISNPASVSQVGSNVSTGANPYSIAISGNYAYLTNGHSGGNLQVFNISNPASVSQVGSNITTGGAPVDIAISGNYAYIVNNSSSNLQVFNISNPASVSQVGSNVSTGVNPESIAISGNSAYVVNGSSYTLQIFNISNPASVSQVGSNVTTGNVPQSVAISGNYAYVVNRSSNTLQVFNVSNPSSVSQVGSNVSTGSSSSPWDVAISGNYAYVANEGTNNFQIYALNPNPTLQVLNSSNQPILAVDATGVDDALTVSSPLNSSANVLTLSNTGSTTFENSSNSTSAFQVQDTSGINLLNVDTTDDAVDIGITPTTLGSTSIGTLYDTGIENIMLARKITPSVSGTLSSINMYYNNNNSTSPISYQVALYSDSSGSPGSLITSSSTQTTYGGWANTSIPASVTGGTSYWLVTNTSSNNVDDSYNSSGGSYASKTSTTFGTWPGTFGTPSFSGSANLALYATEATITGNSVELQTNNNGQVSLGGSPQGDYQLSLQGAGDGIYSDGAVLINSNSQEALSVGGSAYTALQVSDITGISRIYTAFITNGLTADDGATIQGDGADIADFDQLGNSTPSLAVTSTGALQGANATGSNAAGGNLVLNGGQGTGTGNGGNITLQIATPGTSGSTNNSLTTVATISGSNGAATFENATNSTSAFQIQNATASPLLTADTTNTQVTVGGNLNVGTLGGGNTIFTDNFEDNNFDLWGNPADGVSSIESSIVHSGNYAAEFNLSGGTVSHLQADIYSPTNTDFFRAWLYVASQSSSTATLMDIYNGGNGNPTDWYIQRTTSGTICLDYGTGGGGSHCGGSFTTGVWHEVEVQITTGGSSVTNLWMDGNLIFNSTSISNGTTNAEYLSMDNNISDTVNYYLDDLAVTDQRDSTDSSLNVTDNLDVQGSTVLNADVQLDGYSPNAFRIQDANGNLALNIDTTDSYGITTFGTSNNIITPRFNGTTTLEVENYNATNVPLDVDTTDGYVGIGTATPSAELNVTGANLQPTSVSSGNGTSAASALTLIGATGGNTTATGVVNGGTGAGISLTTGTGGTSATTSTGTGGTGGNFSTTLGTGGATTGTSGASTGGTGGSYTLQAGTGGQTAAGNAAGKAGTGGNITIQGGTAAALTNVSQTLGTAGTVTIQGGTGSNGTSTSANGNGGALTLEGGAAGTGGSGTAGTSGSVIVKSNGTNSTTAFQVQNTSGVSLLSVNSFGNGSAPASPGVAAGTNTGGTLSGAAGTTYYYKVSAVLSGGTETPASSEVSINGQSFTKVAVPASAPSAVNAGAGTVPCGAGASACKWEVTYVTANGETTVSAASASQTTASRHWTVTIPVSPAAAVTSRNIYRSDNNGTSYGLVGTVGDNTTTTFNDTSTTIGAAPPGSNTATTNTNEATITWTAAAGAVSYKVYRGTASNAESAYQTSASSPFTDTGAAGTAGTVQTASYSSLIQLTSQETIVSPVTNSTTAFQIQNSGGTSLLTADTTNMAIAINGTLSVATLGSGGSTSLCINGSNQVASCSGGGGNVSLAPSSVQADSSSNNSIFINKTNSSGNLLDLQRGGTNVLTVGNTGNTTFENSSNSTSAFQIQNASGVSLLNADTTNSTLTVAGANGGYTSGTLSLVTTGSQPKSVAISGNYAYVLNYNASNMQVFNISNPDSVTQVGSNITTGTNPYAITISGSYAYVVDYGGAAMQIFNISNPASVTQAGTNVTTDTNPNFIAVSGSYAYVTSVTNNAMQIFNISNPSSVSLTGTASSAFDPVSVSITGSYALLLSQSNVIAVYNVSNPASPSYVTNNGGAGSNSVAMAFAGSYTYALDDGNDTLMVSNVSSPASVTATDIVSTGNNPSAVAVSGNYAYVVNSTDNDMQVFNISNPTAVTQVGSNISAGNGPDGITISGNYAYVLNKTDNTMEIFNISNPSSITGTGTVALPVALQVNGAVNFENSTNSTDAFQIQNASDTNALFNADTVNNTVTISGSYANTAISSVQEWDAHATNQATVAISTHTVGNIVLVHVNIPSTGFHVNSISGGGVSNWQYINSIVAQGMNNETWYGTVTSTGSSTITVTYSGTTGVINEIDAQEFTTLSPSNTTWAIAASNSYSSAASTTLTWPSVTSPAESGALYWGVVDTNGAATTPSTSGFTFHQTGAGNWIGYNATLSANTAYQPSTTQASATYSGAAVIILAQPSTTALTVNGGTTLNGNVSLTSGSTTVDLSSLGTHGVCKNNTGTGNFVLMGCSSSPTADYAELYPTDGNVSAGDIVMPDGNYVTSESGKYQIPELTDTTSAYAPGEMGVISQQTLAANNGDYTLSGNDVPGSNNPMALALNGRVLAKVNTQNGPIVPGDYITASDTTGVGMKATQAGQVVGQALATYGGSGTGEILILINPGYYAGPSIASYIQSGGNATLSALTVGGSADFADLNTSGTATIQTLNVTGDETIGGNLTVTGLTNVTDIQISGHIITAGGTPTITASSAAGTGATVDVSGNDTLGTVTITTGSHPNSGEVAQLEFSKLYNASPKLLLSPANQAAAQAELFSGTTTTSGAPVDAGNTLSANTTYIFNYFIAQ